MVSEDIRTSHINNFFFSLALIFMKNSRQDILQGRKKNFFFHSNTLTHSLLIILCFYLVIINKIVGSNAQNRPVISVEFSVHVSVLGSEVLLFIPLRFSDDLLRAPKGGAFSALKRF